MTATLTRPLHCLDCERHGWTLPAGQEVTVRPLSGSLVAVVLDGRVYRADAAALAGATR